MGEVVNFFFFFSKRLPAFILKARSWSYKGEDIEIKSPLGFKNITKHTKLLPFQIAGQETLLSLAKQAGHKVRINTVLIPRAGRADQKASRSNGKPAGKGDCGPGG